METIKYKDWLKKMKDAQKVSSQILAHFDLSKLRRKPRNPEEEKWLKERGLESKFRVTK